MLRLDRPPAAAMSAVRAAALALLALGACGGARSRTYVVGPFPDEAPASLYARAERAIEDAGYVPRGDLRTGRIESRAQVTQATFVVQCFAQGYVGVTVSGASVRREPGGVLSMPGDVKEEYERFVVRLHDAGLATPGVDAGEGS